MSHLLRCGLVAAGLVVAFAAGFYLKPVPTVPTVAAQPAPAPVVAPPISDPDVKPATALGQPQPARPELDPLDAAGMAMIGKAMGLKTTVLDKSEPLPAVLADAQNALPPIVPPAPMGGPMPRLEPPPAFAAPMIDHAPIRRPDLPPGTMMRITIRDRAGNVMTVTTSGQVTIEPVAPDGPRPGADPGPMPREVGTTAIPEPLRSLLPILLGSPSFLVPVVWADPLTEPVGLKWSLETARQFVETPVVEVEQVERFVRRELFTEPAVGPELTPVPVVDPQDRSDDYGIAFIASRLPESLEEHAQRLEAERARLEAERNRAAFERPIGRFLGRQLTSEQLRPYLETAMYSGGRSLIHHLAEPDWKPTTATPESCRWEYEPAPTNFWGLPPLGLRLDF